MATAPDEWCLAPFTAILAHATVFVDAPSALMLAASATASTPTRSGLRSLVEERGLANIVDLEAALRDATTSAATTVERSKDEPNSSSQPNVAATSLDDSGRNNDLEELEQDEKEPDVATTKAPEQPPRITQFLPLDSSHADAAADADVQQLADASYAEKGISKPSKSAGSKAKAPKAASSKSQGDGWDWQDDDDAEQGSSDEEEDEEEEAPSRSQVPSTPPSASGKACFVINGPLPQSLLVKLAALITSSQSAPAPFRSGGAVTSWKEVHLFSTAPNGTGRESYESITQALTKLIRAQQSHGDLKVHVHHLPLSHLKLASSVFLTPLPSSAALSAVATYPPSLHAPSSASHRPSPAATKPGGSPGVSSSSSLLSNFSISGIAKGLSDHIKEAEQIAMQGANPEADATGEATETSGSSSSAAAALASSLAASLSRTLFSMRLQPDIFAVGHRTTKLAKRTLEHLQALKSESAAAEADSAEAEKKSRFGRKAAASPLPWNSASLILVDRSLDLVTVAQHHPVAGVKDRTHDRELAELPSQSDESSKTLEQITKELLANWSGTEQGASKSHPTAQPRLEEVREQLFGHPGSSETNSVAHLSSLFPPTTSSSTSALLGAIESLADKSSATIAPKTVLALVKTHLHQLLQECGLKPTQSTATTAPQLVGAIELALGQLAQHPHLLLQHRDFYDLVRSLVHSFGPTGGATKSLYDRILAFEQLLQMQFIANTSSASAHQSTNPNEDESTRALQGLARITIDFIQQEGEIQHRNVKADLTPARLPLIDVFRLLVFLYSLIGGRHLMSEADSQQLQNVLVDCVRRSSPSERTWLTRACRWSEQQQQLTDDLIAPLIASFFLQLQGVALARSDLTASDLIDLTAPLESESDSGNATAGLQSFVARLLQRVQQPECLLDDLEHLAFEEEEAVPASEDANSSQASQQPTAEDSSSPSQGWGFFNSIASVVSSVAKSTAAPLRGLGFSAVARPEQRARLVLFVVGGITHTEIATVQRIFREWRDGEIQAEKAEGGTGANAAQRSLLIGSTHIATAEELVRQLLTAAAATVQHAPSDA